MNEPPTEPQSQIAELIAMIAHDLRGPITAIKGFGQLALREADLPPQVRGYLTVTIREANRVASLVDDLVLFSQLDHYPAIRSEPTEILEVLQAAIERSKCLDAAIDVVIENDARGALARCDPMLTERASELLIATVRKYSAPSGSIAIRLRYANDRVIVEVLPGSNLESEKLRALRRVAGAAEEGPADELNPSGLGLYICRRLIELQEGRIWIDQPPNLGTRFMIILPGHSTDHKISPRGDRQQWS